MQNILMIYQQKMNFRKLSLFRDKYCMIQILHTKDHIKIIKEMDMVK